MTGWGLTCWIFPTASLDSNQILLLLFHAFLSLHLPDTLSPPLSLSQTFKLPNDLTELDTWTVHVMRWANLLVDVGQAIQDLPEEPPQAAAVQVQALVNGVAQGALLTVLHLHREERTRGPASAWHCWTTLPSAGAVTQHKLTSKLANHTLVVGKK